MPLAFYLLMGGHFLQALGYSSLLLFPLYLEVLGADRAQIGQIMATAALGSLLTRPLAGWALDHIGRKPTLLLGTALLSLSMISTLFIQKIGPFVYGLRLLMGGGIGTLMTAYFTSASDYIPPLRRTEGLAIFGISGLLPLAMNPLVGRLGLSPIDLRAVFPIIGLIIASSALFLIPIQDQRRPPPREAAVIYRVLLKPKLWPVWWGTIIFAGMVSVYMAFATVSAAQSSEGDPADLWLLYAGTAIGIRLLGARLPDRLGPSNLIVPSIGAYVLAFILAASGERSAFLLSGVLAGLAHGYGFPILSGQVISRIPAERRGAGMAGFTALWDLSALGLGPLAGSLAEAFGDALMFSGLALAALLGLGLWLSLEQLFAPGEEQLKESAEFKEQQKPGPLDSYSS